MAWLLTVCALSYFCFTLTTGCDCGGVLKDNSAIITSPDYPDKYPDNCNCNWDISLDRDAAKVTITFKVFSLQAKEDGVCVDYVRIQGSEPSEQFCGERTSTVLHVTESSFNIEFVSNGQEQGDGFEIEYKAVFDEASVSQATAGIVAAVFCAVVFLGIGALRCILKGSTTCDENHERECVEPAGGEYEMDCPPTYRTVMEHPERYPTPTMTPSGTPLSRRTHSHLSHDGSDVVSSADEDDDIPPPPYPGVIVQVENESNRPHLEVHEFNDSVERSRGGSNAESESLESGRGTSSGGQSSYEPADSTAGTETQYTCHVTPSVRTVMSRDLDDREQTA